MPNNWSIIKIYQNETMMYNFPFFNIKTFLNQQSTLICLFAWLHKTSICLLHLSLSSIIPPSNFTWDSHSILVLFISICPGRSSLLVNDFCSINWNVEGFVSITLLWNQSIATIMYQTFHQRLHCTCYLWKHIIICIINKITFLYKIKSIIHENIKVQTPV